MSRARLFRERQNDVPSPLSSRSRGHFGKSDYGRHVRLPQTPLNKVHPLPSLCEGDRWPWLFVFVWEDPLHVLCILETPSLMASMAPA